MMFIQNATLTNIPAIQRIYAHYVENTTISFEYESPSIDDMTQRFLTVQQHHLPYLVALNPQQEVIGFAYATPYSDRLAYQYSCVLSVYLAPHHVGQGTGARLYEELERQLTERGIVQMVAIITKDNTSSIQFHKRLGFRHIGTFENAGYKFNQWLDIVWLVKTINTHKIRKENLHEKN